jgi:hypothetical protein
MVPSFQASLATLQELLTEGERSGGVVYATEEPVAAGTHLAFPGDLHLDVVEAAYLAFIDAMPSANWGHPARFVLIGREGGASRSVEARFPPFGQPGDLRWRLVYRAPSVPDAAVAFPQR